MRKDTTFSENKLTTEEFSKKYWLDGTAPDQYHTATIEDGRDEREQFIINNIRALDKMMKRDANLRGEMMESLREKSKKITILAVTSMVISTIAFLFVLFEIVNRFLIHIN